MTQRVQSLESEGLGSNHAASLAPEGFTGTVNLKLNDLIQMVCLARSDLTIRVKSVVGSGFIHVKEGEIYHAQTETLDGESAFFEILRWKDGHFEMHLFEGAEVNTVNKPWEHLLLEGMRRRDEEAIKQNHAILAELEEEFYEGPQAGELDDEIDHVFDGLELTAQQMMEEEANQIAMSLEAERKVRVLVVDDSSFFARQLKKMLEADPNLEVVATAKNGKEALDFLASDSSVDLITLDIQMPVMPGDTTLKHIMIRHPIPVLILSALPAHSLNKVFEFLQVGAIDFFPKPEAKDDIVSYGENLRDLARRVARADVSRFKRWRKPKNDALHPARESDSNAKRVLVIIGAEGAYMDWFRLPLSHLCSQGIVIGCQKLPDSFLVGFSRLVEEGTGAKSEPLLTADWLNPGRFYLGNANAPIETKLLSENISLRIGIISTQKIPWDEGIHQWLDQIAAEVGENLTVYLLSAASCLPSDLIEKLIEAKSRLIMAPRDRLMCKDLVDGVEAYSLRYPQQITWGEPEKLMEVWLKDEPET